MNEMFTYEVHSGDWINKWMISPIKEERYWGEPKPFPSHYHVNMSKVISPIRIQFVEESSFEKEDSELLACDTLYFPFETNRMDRSTFWKLPTTITCGAEVTLEVPEAGEYPFRIMTCCSVKVFANGEKQAESYISLLKDERELAFSLKLQSGKNKVYVLMNDLGERDTRVYFKLQYLGDKNLISHLPCVTDMTRLEKTRHMLEGIYLKEFSFHSTDMELFFGNLIEDDTDATVTMEFRDSHAPSHIKTKNVVLHKGEPKLYIGDLVSQKVGLVFVTIEVSVGDVKLHRTLNFEYYDETAMPREGLDTIKGRKQAALHFLAEHSVDNFPKILALRETGTHEELAKKIFAEEMVHIRNREDCADFRLPALVYAYCSPHFTEAEKEEMKQILLGFRYWIDEPGNDVMWFFSENHALLFHTAEYLAGELFEDEVFSNNGMTGAWHKGKAKERLTLWFNNFFTYGFNEWNSPVYIPIDMIGFFALYDLAKDAEVKTMAERALNKAFSVFAANCFKGAVSGSYGRTYFKNLIGRRISESTALNFIASGEGVLGHHTFATVMFALSDYEPSEEVMKLYHVPAEGKVTENWEGEEKVHLYSYKTPDYIMGSVLDYHPGERGIQEHVFQLMVKDLDTQIWINHPGEAIYFGEGRPSYFAGNGTLPLVKQEKNRAELEYHLLEQEVDYTHAFCPLKEFDQYILDGNWMYLKKENVYIAIYASNGILVTEKGPLKHYELISMGADTTWKVIVEEESTYGSFENFILQIK